MTVPAGDAWLSVWAKTDRDPLNRTEVTHWLPLHEHSADAAEVAGLLVDHWVSANVIDRIAASLDGQQSMYAWLQCGWRPCMTSAR
jgi:hypothetical protein